jgi:chromosome partitioning protein
MANTDSNEFLVLVSDLASLLNITLQGLHKFLKANGYKATLSGAKSYLTPEQTRQLLLSKGLTYKQQIISLQMLKGGVAKTTSALNIALRANMYGSRVLLVDLDQQANLSFSVGVEDMNLPVWVDILEGKIKIKSAIKEITPTLHLIPSNLNNSMLDRVLLNGKRNVATGVSQYLSDVKADYDLIIIDTAPSLSAINTAVSCASDTVILPVNPDKFSYVGLVKTVEDLAKIRSEFNVHFKESILFVKFDGRETASHELLKLCFANFGDKMLKSFVRTSTEVKNTIRTGKTIYDHKTPAKEDYDLVTREIIGLA